MTVRPILFSAPMVRAILDGRKTQTRRALRPNKLLDVLPLNDKSGWIGLLERGTETVEPKGQTFRCKYGLVGDGLWVRETHYVWKAGNVDGSGRHIAYRATDPGSPCSWTPSIHMPRWASRITLKITDVRCQRLQDISEADAIAEGCPAVSLHDLDCASTPPSEHYRKLWNSINGKGSWDTNPWVWALSFTPQSTGDDRGT